MSKIKDALFGAADKKSVEEAIAEQGGSGSGGYDPYIVEINTQSMTTDADFATAKEKFLANEPVLFRVATPNAGVNIVSAIAFANDGETDVIAAYFGDSTLRFKSDGTIVES